MDVNEVAEFGLSVHEGAIIIGRQEVVDWVENNAEPSFVGERATLKFFKRLNNDKWEKQKKEWGL